ncbi:SET and MYND domain-containing protein 4 [Pseudocercospora fuligena]|uniref:SET and MYND domain-containing protein 4 n=1 Tax=Pseudocercospora fuligena TaxID=685502 RepID=A0A8H6VNR4_9PEZI|nr:SET and MYND domain-containing protein 4 [Pseudocercospora fuligena]
MQRHDSNTIYLTAGESEKIRNDAQSTIAKCKSSRGQPRSSRNRQALFQLATAESLMADMAGETNVVVKLTIAEPYEPSITPVDVLRPMMLSELAHDTHHRGRMLCIRREAPVVVQNGRSWTVVEDDAGDVERLELYLHTSYLDDDILESGYQFVIKEPYLTIGESEESVIRVHHPGDVICIQTRASTELPQFMSERDDIQVRAMQCKEIGNAALKNDEPSRAWMNYSEGIRLLKEGSGKTGRILLDLNRNRAQANLLLHRFEEAEQDALASITTNSDSSHALLDSKAYFRAACAAYSRQDYGKAKQHLLNALDLAPSDQAVQVYLRRTEHRFREGSRGTYDFAKIRRSLTLQRPRVDAASFTGNVEVRKSMTHGNGLFAKTDLAAGDLVFCEKAFCSVWRNESQSWTGMFYDARDDQLRALPAGLMQRVVEELRKRPSMVPQVTSLFSDWKGTSSSASSDTIDAFQVHDIVARNAFGAGSSFHTAGEPNIVERANSGLWIVAAHSNHSCVPNTAKTFIGDLMIVRATKSICAGEEILHSYIDESVHLDERAAALSRNWSFTCACALCVAERADGPAVRSKRAQLIGAAEKLASTTSPHNAGRPPIARARGLYKAISETYDLERYHNVPRHGLAQIQEWLEHAGAK